MKGYLVKYLSCAAGPDPAPLGQKTIVLLEVHPVVWASWHFGLRDDEWIEVTSWQEFDCPEYAWTAISGARRLNTLTLDEMLEQRYRPNDGSEENDKIIRDAEDLIRHYALQDYARALRADAEGEPAQLVSRLLRCA